MIRILSISRLNLQAGRTNVYNFAKTCEVVNAQEGFKTTLVTTDQERDRETFFQKTGIHQPFDIVCLGVTDTSSTDSTEILSFLRANLSLIAFMTKQKGEFDAVYFRDESLAPAAWFAKRILGKPLFLEIHSVLQSRSRQKLNMLGIKQSNGIIAISSGLKHYYEKWNKNILVSLCSAAEESWFDYSRGKESFREELRLPTDKFIIGYIGVVGANPNNDYYEIDDIVRSLQFLPSNIVVVIGGELNGNAEWLREIARESGVEGRIIIRPWLERSIVPNYLQASDIILIPKRKKDLIGDSPAKMFPALASKRPIVAGRAESIEEVLTDNVDALIVEQNNPEGWVKAILKIYENPELGQKLFNQAWVTKDKYTWEKRGVAIGGFIKTLIK